MTQAQPPRGPRWWVHIAFVSGGVAAGLIAFAVAYWWFSARSGDSGQYDVVRSAVAATGVITVGAGAAVALRRQKTSEDDAARAQAAHELTQQSVNATLDKLSLEADANLTDRYTKAVEQLGSDSIHVRLGGIYALKRLADDSKRDLPTIVEVLAAFIRAATAAAKADETERRKEHPDNPPHARRPSTDVDAALTSLSRINATVSGMIDLRRAYLVKANLSDANLVGAYLSDTRFEGAYMARANLADSRIARTILTYADLTRADLTRVELTGSRMAHTDLIDANLTCAILAGVDLIDANLTRAILTRANLVDARMIDTILTDADLTGADLTRVRMARADLTGADLTGAILTDVDLYGADLTGANLFRANLSDASLPNTNLSDANLPNTDLSGANLTRANLSDTFLTEADLTGADLEGANLTGADLEGANLTGADLEGANLTCAFLYDANLTRADLTNANLHKITWEGTTWPDGFTPPPSYAPDARPSGGTPS